MYPKKRKHNELSWLWLIISIVMLVIFANACSGGSSGSGPVFPLDSSHLESSDLAQEYEEGQREMDAYDQYLKDKWDRYSDEASRELKELDPACEPPSGQEENWIMPAHCFSNSSEFATTKEDSSCPDGCESHKPGCDIKGNISVDTEEKIYHVPGQKYYEETIIRPEYGERWFCTEEEAKANGWRKSKE